MDESFNSAVGSRLQSCARLLLCLATPLQLVYMYKNSCTLHLKLCCVCVPPHAAVSYSLSRRQSAVIGRYGHALFYRTVRLGLVVTGLVDNAE
jgi:hypothetical protein